MTDREAFDIPVILTKRYNEDKSYREGYQARSQHYEARIKELEMQIETLATPSYFGTEDEHFAQSLEDLAEQFVTSYDAGDVIEVHLQHDLGTKEYLFGFDVKGLPILTPFIEQALTDKG